MKNVLVVIAALCSFDVVAQVDTSTSAEAPLQELTILDTDDEFDGDSGIRIRALNVNQIESLKLLSRIWGFLKYHHPRVTNGEIHWDYELFRIMPTILASRDEEERNAAFNGWISDLGIPPDCSPCAEIPIDAHLLPELEWIDDSDALGPVLSSSLRLIFENRSISDEQFFVRTASSGANPAIFQNELAYDDQPLPDSGYRLLALFRYWNMVEYWFPYRDVIGEPWVGVLDAYIPEFVFADTRQAYISALVKLVATIHDTHAGLSPAAAAQVTPPIGPCRIPIAVRFLQGSATIGMFTNPDFASTTDLLIGDVIEGIDGQPLSTLITNWAPYYSGSNRASVLRNMSSTMAIGACGVVELGIRRGSDSLTVEARRIPTAEAGWGSQLRHDRSGDTVQWLTDEIAYVKISSLTRPDVSSIVDMLTEAQGLIVDIRNYPRDEILFSFVGHFVHEPTAFAAIIEPDIQNPGTFVWDRDLPNLNPRIPTLEMPVVVLVNELTQSAAEYLAMAFRSAPNTTIIGSTTAGADGNVSRILLPGGYQTIFTGLGVFYPDGSPTQRVGIVPDVFVEPTPAGIAERRDEVLESALRFLARDSLSDQAIIEIARVQP